MDVSQPTQTPNQTQPANPPATSDQTDTVLSSDFETFIRMLTVQMQNQDPLNPLESTEFATQLATFSSVEQQVLTNDLLSDLGAQLSALGVSQLSGWIGMEGRAHVPVEFDGQPVTLTTHGSSLADTHELVVRDTNGVVVQRLETTGERQTVAWAGYDSNGNPLPNGTYQIDIESFSQGALVATSPVQVHGRITEARIQNGQTHLVLEGGQEVISSNILGLREP
ncbi:flagellar hook capping FlgD N-terminal domain-containing protein [Roseovarius rhodophyticola]|uniref:Basal-body rod modification protein FlgD n=1 Tax=Roseovarius rhodophyticola TaxID=3080827 RepID=A0ABZ2TIU6_9RHOB|nr:flagellar hook capping FlgD N-terminal domain-containing protein [Roseovarius sp. W115]MDV2929976.1 flagellar hook capping FlgD N-terminal domain-containing protein [Roseovarius sp. W115]